MIAKSSVAVLASSLIFVGAAVAQTPSTDTGTPSPPPAAVPGTTIPSTPDSAAPGAQISTSPTLTRDAREAARSAARFRRERRAWGRGRQWGGGNAVSSVDHSGTAD